MTPAAPTRLAWIEAGRGIAATAVVLYHAERHLDANYGAHSLRNMFQFGHAGVDLFFVISGFIILFVHFDDVGRPQQLRRYIARRLTRILPIYWIALGLTICRRWAGGHATPLSDVAWAVLPVPISADPVLGVAWTLQYELVFYAAFGVMILSRAAGIVVMGGWLVVIVIAAACVSRSGAGCSAAADCVPEAYWGIYNLEFFGGMGVAYWLRKGNLRQYKSALAAGFVLFVTAAIAEDCDWMDGYGLSARLAYGLPAALIVFGGAEASRRSDFGLPAVPRMVGAASYSIYLFHLMLIGAIWQLWRACGLDQTVPPWVSIMAFSSAAVVAGVMISRLVEYPLMRLIRGVWVRPWLRRPSKIA